MPLRDFRNVEYYRIKKDNSWDTAFCLVPTDVDYENVIDYILNEISGSKEFSSIQSIAICNYPQTFSKLDYE